MDELALTKPLPPSPSTEPVLETPAGRLVLVAARGPLPEGTDVALLLPDATRIAYVPRAPGGEAKGVQADPFLRGNQFKPLHASPRALAAQLSIAPSRRVETGPESERVFVFLRGSGLVFLNNGDVFRFEAHHVGFIPAGEPALVWSQGPEDALVIVFQPAGQQAERRTLAGELAKLKAKREPGASE